MGIRYFKAGDGYLGVTNQSPKAFAGQVFLGRGPLRGEVVDQLYSTTQLEKLQPVAACDVPDDWFAELGLEERPVAKAVELVIELPGDKLRQQISAKRGTADYYRWRRKRKQFALYLIVSVIVSWWWVFT